MTKRGFTLIELMIVTAIIGILAAIALPKFADLIRKSKEGSTKGNLGAVRGALALYYGAMEGNYPIDNLSQLTAGGKYINSIPLALTPGYHNDNSGLLAGADKATVENDAGGWSYVNNSGSVDWGALMVNCTHTDTKGTTWSTY